MDTITQLVTIAGVVLGALTTYVTNHLMWRSKQKRKHRTRWYGKKLDAYSSYIGSVRASIHASVLLYEVRERMRRVRRSVRELEEDLTNAGGAQALAFERVMLLADDAVIECAHAVQEAMAAIGWQARGVVDGTLEEWRQRHSAAFEAINRFHECARGSGCQRPIRRQSTHRPGVAAPREPYRSPSPAPARERRRRFLSNCQCVARAPSNDTRRSRPSLLWPPDAPRATKPPGQSGRK